jgi:hypothetical protein
MFLKRHIAICGRKNTGKDTLAAMLAERAPNAVIMGLADELKRFAGAFFDVPNYFMFGTSSQREMDLPRKITKKYLKQWLDEMLSKYVSTSVVESIYNTLEKHAPIVTVRRLLQLLGTEWGRERNKSIWLHELRRNAARLRQPDRMMSYSRTVGIYDNPTSRMLTPRLSMENDHYVIIPDCRFANEAEFLQTRMDALIIWVDASQRIKVIDNEHSSEPKFEDLKPYVNTIYDTNGPKKSIKRSFENLCSWLEVTGAASEMTKATQPKLRRPRQA